MGCYPAVHSVHIYQDDSALIGRLCGIVTSGLQVGDSVLIVATAAHRDQLVHQLEKAGVEIRDIAREARFTMLDAKQVLSAFMRNGSPDRPLFMASVGQVLTDAGKTAKSRDHGLTVFGEMVAVLWSEGQRVAAIELEALWNEALGDRAFHLHCAYPRAGFVGDDDEGFTAIVQAHSHLIQ